MKSIGNWAFEGCSNLATITLPNTLESIGYAAFHDCASLTSLKIPANVKDISAGIVNKGCTSLTGITFAMKGTDEHDQPITMSFRTEPQSMPPSSPTRRRQWNFSATNTQRILQNALKTLFFAKNNA